MYRRNRGTENGRGRNEEGISGRDGRVEERGERGGGETGGERGEERGEIGRAHV